MSNNDSFIEEVSEEVRRDQLWGYARTYGWIPVVLIVAAVGLTAWNEYSKAQRVAAAQDLGDRLLAATEKPDATERAAALAEAAQEAGDAAVLVNLRRAAALVEAGDEEAALAILDEIASAGGDPLYAELAALKAVILRGDSLSPEDRIAAVEPLAAPGAPFRPLALEQKAEALIEAQDKAGAIEVLNEILEDSQTTDGGRARAAQLLVALGGTLSPTSRLLSGQ